MAETQATLGANLGLYGPLKVLSEKEAEKMVSRQSADHPSRINRLVR